MVALGCYFCRATPAGRARCRGAGCGSAPGSKSTPEATLCPFPLAFAIHSAFRGKPLPLKPPSLLAFRLSPFTDVMPAASSAGALTFHVAAAKLYAIYVHIMKAIFVELPAFERYRPTYFDDATFRD